VLAVIGRRGREVIGEMFPRLDELGSAPRPSWNEALEAARRRPLTQTLTHATEPRTITHLDIDALVRLASASDAVIVLECAVGDSLVEDTVLLRVFGGDTPIREAALRRGVGLAKERTFEQDPKYPLRLLVDIAIKALSPAINDPTTAVQALDQIEDLLRRLGRHVLDSGCVGDAGGTVRLVFPTPTWDDYLGLAFDEIRQFGGGSVQVMRRLRSALVGVAESATDPGRREAVQRYLRHLDAVVGRSGLDADDQAMARQEDRQGLGLSRTSAAPST